MGNYTSIPVEPKGTKTLEEWVNHIANVVAMNQEEIENLLGGRLSSLNIRELTADKIVTGTLLAALVTIASSLTGQRVVIDDSGLHTYDEFGIERLTIGTAPVKGVKAITGRDATGIAQSVYAYDTETVDGAVRTGQYITAHGAYLLLESSGSFRMQDSAGRGIRAAGTRPEVNDGFGWSPIAKKSEVDAKANAFTGFTGSFSTGTQTINVSNGIITSVV
ncbi:hypothetical protein [Paenibacillus sp. HJGM_3]|uniref:hypothetical protein n=1 Tax=Paenibacillus sp. HJGM_3 TaxID=3379816 RepID=UPI00385BB81C